VDVLCGNSIVAKDISKEWKMVAMSVIMNHVYVEINLFLRCKAVL
jgi:hypothetical protein